MEDRVIIEADINKPHTFVYIVYETAYCCDYRTA